MNTRSIIDSLGLIPPQSLELEEAIIGACIMDRTAIITARKYLSAEMFYAEKNGLIFDAIGSLSDERKPVDLLTVVDRLSGDGYLDAVGGAVYVAKMSGKVGSSAHLEYHCQAVYEKYCRREFITLSERIKSEMYDESTDLLESAMLLNATTTRLLSLKGKDEKHISEAIDDAVNESIRINEKDPTLVGVNSGFTYFDKFSGGIQRGDLVIIGGEPSNGKTTLALNICQNAAVRSNLSVAIFSYEMTLKQIAARMMAYDQQFSSKQMLTGEIDRANLMRISGDCIKLKNSNIRLIKPKGSSFSALRNDIARVKVEHNVGLIMIDYLQLISNSRHGANKAELTGEMSNELKAIAVEIDTPIILLSQLARDPNNPRPHIGRLKYSGDIEAAADTVLMPYLPFKYNKLNETVNGETVSVEENAIVIIGKGRNIGTGEFLLKFKKEIPGFYNMPIESVPMPKEDEAPRYNNRMPFVDSEDVPF